MSLMMYEQLAGDRQRELIARADEYRRARWARRAAARGPARPPGGAGYHSRPRPAALAG